MRETYVPYTKLVDLTNTNAVTVPLVDSSGVSIKCNYIQISAAVSSADGFFFVTPDITSAKGFANQPTGGLIPNNDTSGAVGIVANRETGVVVLSLPPSDKTSTIKISQSDSVACKYVVTYGNVKLSNTLADNTLPRGN